MSSIRLTTTSYISTETFLNIVASEIWSKLQFKNETRSVDEFDKKRDLFSLGTYCMRSLFLIISII